MSLAKQLAENGMTISVSEARRLVVMKAVKVNGSVASDELQLREGDEVQIARREPKTIGGISKWQGAKLQPSLD